MNLRQIAFKAVNAPDWRCVNGSRGTWILVLVLLAGGCSHKQRHHTAGAAVGQEWLPRPPEFLTGPAVLLLTNAGGFSAHLVLAASASSPASPASGQLVACGSKFFFEPEPGTGKPTRSGGFSFIWDATTATGYVLSEALQGYAPIGCPVRFTNLVVQSSHSVVDKATSQAVEQASVAVVGSDGKESRFEVLRAANRGGLPLRLDSLGDPPPLTVTLSQLRQVAPAPGLFLPPEGFTAYESEEAMMTELALRQQGGQRVRHEGAADGKPDAGGRGHHSRTGSDTGS